MSWRELFWGWRGRINRAQFLTGLIIAQIGCALAAYAAVWVFSPRLPPAEHTHLADDLSLIAALPFFASMYLRRLHDVGYNATFLIIAGVSIVIQRVILEVAPHWDRSIWVALIGMPWGLLFFFLLIALGEERENRFGARPMPGLPDRW